MAREDQTGQKGREQKAATNKRRSRPKNESREVLVSKKLSWLLRHGADQEGLKLGKGGYVPLDDVLQNRKIKPFKITLEEIQQLVADNEKQRFSIVHVSFLENTDATPATTNPRYLDCENVESAKHDDSDPSHYLIRANQGHSLKIEEEGLLEPITAVAGNLPETVVHGTRRELWAQIVASGGLKPMTRNHVHFATAVPDHAQSNLSTTREGNMVSSLPDKKSPVTLSGMRSSSTIFMFLDLRKALDDGLQFWMSQNGVVLSDGGDKRLLDLRYFEKVEERSGTLLVQDGKIVADLPPKAR
ncbi:MAG: hypothetical protein M1828_005874 [Chrysothrix sp. TS-e1954]|nr:MAG: hypothetical protein M1828_005874 [Chrysothrix sp. TS-e1954]